LALDNLLAAEVVLADGRTVVADAENESELFWALRGGGGNFGVVTKMWHRMHDLPSVTTGVLVYPLAEARGILKRCAEIAVSAPDELTIQLAFAMGPDGSQVAMVVPNWCGPPHEGEALLAPFSQLGTLLAGRVAAMPYGTSLALFDGHIVNGLRTFMETCWLPTIEDGSDVLVEAMESAVSPGCAIIVHDFKGAASRVPIDATAFALRHDHMLVEILAAFVDRSETGEEERHRQWALSTRLKLSPRAFPGGYPNLLASGDVGRAAISYGRNADRLVEAKRTYDPDNLFRSAIPLPSAEAPVRHRARKVIRGY